MSTAVEPQELNGQSANSVSLNEPTVSELERIAGYQPESKETEGLLTSEEEAALEGEGAGSRSRKLVPDWRNPYLKLMVVGSVLGAAFLVLGSLLFKAPPAEEEPTAPLPAQTVEPPTETEKQEQNQKQQAELEELQKEVALGTQIRALSEEESFTSVARPSPAAAASQPVPRQEPINYAPAAARPSLASPQPIPARQPLPTPVRYNPTPPASDRSFEQPISPRRSQPLALPRLANSQVSRVPVVTPSPSVNSEPPVDPYERLQTLRTFGSYGKVAYATPTTTAQPGAAPAIAPVPTPLVPTTNTLAQASDSRLPATPAVVQADRTYEQHEAAILTGQPLKQVRIPAFATASAQLETALVYSPDSPDQPMSTVRLLEPMLATDGTPALPLGTRLIARVGVAASGLVNFSIAGVMLPDATEPMAIAPDIFAVSAQEGQALLAELRATGGKREGNSLFNAALSGLARVGEILNRADFSSNVSSSSGDNTTSIVTTENSASVVGAVLEGAAGELSRQNNERRQQSRQTSAAEYFYLEAGTPLAVTTQKPLLLSGN